MSRPYLSIVVAMQCQLHGFVALCLVVAVAAHSAEARLRAAGEASLQTTAAASTAAKIFGTEISFTIDNYNYADLSKKYCRALEKKLKEEPKEKAATPKKKKNFDDRFIRPVEEMVNKAADTVAPITEKIEEGVDAMEKQSKAAGKQIENAADEVSVPDPSGAVEDMGKMVATASKAFGNAVKKGADTVGDAAEDATDAEGTTPEKVPEKVAPEIKTVKSDTDEKQPADKEPQYEVKSATAAAFPQLVVGSVAMAAPAPALAAAPAPASVISPPPCGFGQVSTIAEVLEDVIKDILQSTLNNMAPYPVMPMAPSPAMPVASLLRGSISQTHRSFKAAAPAPAATGPQFSVAPASPAPAPEEKVSVTLHAGEEHTSAAGQVLGRSVKVIAAVSSPVPASPAPALPAPAASPIDLLAPSPAEALPEASPTVLAASPAEALPAASPATAVQAARPAPAPALADPTTVLTQAADDGSLEDKLDDGLYKATGIHPTIKDVEVETKSYELWSVDTCKKHFTGIVKDFTMAYTREQVPNAIYNECTNFFTRITFSDDLVIDHFDQKRCRQATIDFAKSWDYGQSKTDLDTQSFGFCSNVCELKYGANHPSCSATR